jgi:hypothetical protein
VLLQREKAAYYEKILILRREVGIGCGARAFRPSVDTIGR